MHHYEDLEENQKELYNELHKAIILKTNSVKSILTGQSTENIRKVYTALKKYNSYTYTLSALAVFYHDKQAIEDILDEAENIDILILKDILTTTQQIRTDKKAEYKLLDWAKFMQHHAEISSKSVQYNIEQSQQIVKMIEQKMKQITLKVQGQHNHVKDQDPVSSPTSSREPDLSLAPSSNQKDGNEKKPSFWNKHSGKVAFCALLSIIGTIAAIASGYYIIGAIGAIAAVAAFVTVGIVAKEVHAEYKQQNADEKSILKATKSVLSDMLPECVKPQKSNQIEVH